jgi:hypothetical protein
MAKASKEAAKDSGLQNEAARPTQAMVAEQHAGYNKKQDKGAKASEKTSKYSGFQKTQI